MKFPFINLTFLSTILVFIFCLIVIIGWQYDIIGLRNILLRAPQTTPLTVALLSFLSFGMLMAKYAVISPIQTPKWIGVGFISLAIGVILWTTAQYIFKLNPGLELFLYKEKVIQQSNVFPGRPSPHTLLSGLFVGTAIFLALIKPGFNKSIQILIYLGLIVPWIALFGYASLSGPFYSMPYVPEIGMSPITAICFILLSFGTMGLFPSTGLLSLINSSTSGGLVVRILLPVAVLLPLIMSWIFNYFPGLDLVTFSLNMSLSWALTSILMGTLIIWGGGTIRKRDELKESLLTNLKNSEKRISKILESTPDAMIITNSLGKIVMANSQTEIMFGYSKSTLINQSIEFLLPDRYSDTHIQHRTDYLKKPVRREMSGGLNLIGKHKNGDEINLEISLSPIQIDSEIWICAALRDVTDKKLREKEILKLNKELEAFSYSVSHDLNAPLRSIHGFAKILEEDYSQLLDVDGKEYLTGIIRNSDRMANLIDGLLQFSRMGRKEPHRTRINSYEMVGSIIENQKKNKKELLKKYDIKTGDLPVIYGDDTLIRQVFVNLISNAIKYSSKSPTPKIEITAIDDEKKWTFLIRDNGIGFDMKYASKLFQVFQRLHKESEFPGTGIGLALVNRIIEKHNGSIWAESEPEKGATFFFSLPRQ